MKNITGADSEFYEGGADTPGVGGAGRKHTILPLPMHYALSK